MVAVYNVARGSGIIALNSLGGSTRQCDTWLWIMSLNSPGGSILQCGTWFWNYVITFNRWQHPALDHVIKFARWQHPAMWQVALGLSLHLTGGSTLQCNTWLWITSLNSPGGSTLQCCQGFIQDFIWGGVSKNWGSQTDIPVTHLLTQGWHATEFAQMSAILEFYFRCWFWPHHCSRHVILYQSAKFHPNQIARGRKMTSCRFSRWGIFAILDFRGSIMGCLTSPCTTSYRSSIKTIAVNCLVFEKIGVFAFWRQTNKQT